MATDKNDFDDWLKHKLYRDLIFRAIVWAVISTLAAYYAIEVMDIKPIDYLDRMGKSLGKLVNSLGSVALLLCLPALLFKDLEETLENPSFKSFMKGRPAGIIRRLAGDLSLWLLGAAVTMLSSFVLVAFRVTIETKEYGVIALFVSIMILLIIVSGGMNFFVRRIAPSPLTQVIRNPTIIVLIYLACTVGLAFVALKPFFAG
ncbi:hypothetical protein [Pseudomonas sp. GM30]|uniref:hypothetical protein n=1 Tax=Pseudomonas sp. GM30 TaxID=1144328 RepID=UPI00027023F6|nr:hypothetical protein [Pseudomonas sp. GM30]EUB87707.1 hypothetical protein PMI25_003604 [Pseudomonas sp. GM30]